MCTCKGKRVVRISIVFFRKRGWVPDILSKAGAQLVDAVSLHHLPQEVGVGVVPPSPQFCDETFVTGP